MRPILLWISILTVIGIAGFAALGNSIDVNTQGIGIIGYFVNCVDNDDEPLCEFSNDPFPNDVAAAKLPDLAVDVASTRVLGSASGCTPNDWAFINDFSRLQWPEGYSPNDKYGSPSYFNTIITISSGEDPTLQEALLAQGDGINKLARESVAALLNSAHSEMNYPLSIIDAISNTQAGIANEEYSYADILEGNNNLGNENLCNK
jgi:hypothetical protein